MGATTVCRRVDEETKSGAGEEVLARAADFEELFRDLVEEAGRALEADDLEWCALLQGFLIPRIEAVNLRPPRETPVAA